VLSSYFPNQTLGNSSFNSDYWLDGLLVFDKYTYRCFLEVSRFYSVLSAGQVLLLLCESMLVSPYSRSHWLLNSSDNSASVLFFKQDYAPKAPRYTP